MKQHRQNALLCVVVITILALATACTSSNRCVDQPCSSSEIVARLAEVNEILPVYAPEPSSAYPDVVPEFYYFADGSKTELVTFFFPKKAGGDSTRIAKMFTSLGLPTLNGAMHSSKKVPVVWANEFETFTCDFTPGTFRADSLPGDKYQTCLGWKSRRHWFLFYSVLPFNETLALINSLERVR